MANGQEDKIKRSFYLTAGGKRVTKLTNLRVDVDKVTAHAPELPAPLLLEDIAPRRVASKTKDKKPHLYMESKHPKESGLYEFDLDNTAPGVTKEDMQMIGTTLEEYRIAAALSKSKKGYGRKIATIIYLMKQIGITGEPVKISIIDEKNMETDLKILTDAKDTINAGVMRMMRSRLGLGAELGEEANPVYKELLKSRDRKNGFGVAMSYYLMKHLRVNYRVTPQDRSQDISLMEKELENQRTSEEKNGVKLGLMLLYMNETGIKTQATVEDRRVMNDELSKFRENENGMGVAWMHYLLRELRKKE